MILTEGDGAQSLQFEFSDDWTVLKYDAPTVFYGTQVQGRIKAIDFIATNGDEMLWVEVKNYRGFDLKNRPKLSPSEPLSLALCRDRCSEYKDEVRFSRRKPYLGDEIVEKVRGTFLGLIGALRNNDKEMEAYVNDFMCNVPIHIILFLHQDTELDQIVSFKPLASRLKTKIEQGLSFLKVHVSVVNELTLPVLPKSAEWRLLNGRSKD